MGFGERGWGLLEPVHQGLGYLTLVTLLTILLVPESSAHRPPPDSPENRPGGDQAAGGSVVRDSDLP